MKRYFQNRIAESKLALPLTAIYAAGIWLLSGLTTEDWWLQFGCFVVAAYLMAELNNINALIRIYSRMMSCSFLALSCCTCFLFPSLQGAILQTCFIGVLLLLFMTYQDKEGAGLTYYSFLLTGLSSMAIVHILYLVPVLWLLMLTQLQSLSWRTFGASLLGLLTPYWIGTCFLVWKADFMPLINHLSALGDFHQPFDYAALSVNQIAYFAVTIVLFVTGTIHYIRQHHDDKIRIRMLYGFFIWMTLAATLFLVLQPQHYDMLMRIITICTAPLIAHFFALTHTKITNVAFIITLVVILSLTGYNLWTQSSLF